MSYDDLGEKLIKANAISEKDLTLAQEYQKSIGGSLEEILVKLDLIDENLLAEFKADEEKIKFVNLDDVKLDPKLMKIFPKDKMISYGIVPLSDNGKELSVAMSDPDDYEIINELAFTTQKKIKPVISTHSNIQKKLNYFYYGKSKLDEEMMSKGIWERDLEKLRFGRDPEPVKAIADYLEALTRSLISKENLDTQRLNELLVKYYKNRKT